MWHLVCSFFLCRGKLKKLTNKNDLMNEQSIEHSRVLCVPTVALPDSSMPCSAMPGVPTTCVYSQSRVVFIRFRHAPPATPVLPSKGVPRPRPPPGAKPVAVHWPAVQHYNLRMTVPLPMLAPNFQEFYHCWRQPFTLLHRDEGTHLPQLLQYCQNEGRTLWSRREIERDIVYFSHNGCTVLCHLSHVFARKQLLNLPIVIWHDAAQSIALASCIYSQWRPRYCSDVSIPCLWLIDLHICTWDKLLQFPLFVAITALTRRYLSGTKTSVSQNCLVTHRLPTECISYVFCWPEAFGDTSTSWQNTKSKTLIHLAPCFAPWFIVLFVLNRVFFRFHDWWLCVWFHFVISMFSFKNPYFVGWTSKYYFSKCTRSCNTRCLLKVRITRFYPLKGEWWILNL